MEPGRLDNLAKFQKRTDITPIAGNARSNAYSVWLRVWSNFRPVSGAEQADNGGKLEDVAQAILRVRDTPATRDINASQRVEVKGFDWAIKSIMPPDRRTGLIEMSIERKKAG